MFDTEELVINMGPQHPSTHGVLRVVLRLDGEKVVDSEVVIGYLHRGIEKLSENRNWTQIILLTDRMDYVAAATNNVGYCQTVEKLMQLEVPRRARYVRMAFCELQRIASHCLWLGTHAMDIGAMTVFLYAFRERELILDLFEEYCGARLTYNSMRIGGLPLDIPVGWDKKVLEFCNIMSEKLDEYEELLTHNRIWLERTKGIGVITAEQAIAIGLSGPPLRGSGVTKDVRKDEPYAAYDEMKFEVPIGTAGDTYDRYLVRLEEFRQSIRIIRQAIEGLPEGPIVGKVPRLIKPPAGETYHAIESPKGEIGYFIVSDGKSTNPYRFRVRPPSFCNLQALPQLIKGHMVADVVALIGSIDVVLGEVGPVIDTYLIPLLKILFVLNATLIGVTYMVLLERKVIAWVQVRLGPMRVGPVRRASADRRRDQADPQGRHHADARRQVGVHGGADHRDGAGAHHVRRHPVRPDRASVRPRYPALHHRRQRRAALHRVGRLDRRVRHHPRRMGVEQQVPAAREPARVGAAHQLRSRRDDDARQPHHDGGLAEHGEDRRGAGQRRTSGSSSCSRSRSCCSSSAASPRPTARRSTWRKPSRS